jgi:hypothetical protein
MLTESNKPMCWEGDFRSDPLYKKINNDPIYIGIIKDKLIEKEKENVFNRRS